MSILRVFHKALIDANLVQSFSGVRTVFGLGPGISDELNALAVAYEDLIGEQARTLPPW